MACDHRCIDSFRRYCEKLLALVRPDQWRLGGEYRGSALVIDFGPGLAPRWKRVLADACIDRYLPGSTGPKKAGVPFGWPRGLLRDLPGALRTIFQVSLHPVRLFHPLAG